MSLKKPANLADTKHGYKGFTRKCEGVPLRKCHEVPTENCDTVEDTR